MRPPRLKPKSAWHHCYNRAAGCRGDQPIGKLEKEVFYRILKRMNRLYTVETVSFCVMDNHFHLILRAPEETPGEAETLHRYKEFHRGKRELAPGTMAARRWQARLRDVSCFLQHVQQVFTIWHNKHQPGPRRGYFWGSRFKNTVLEDGAALRKCWAYVENNSVRAGMVRHPSAYRFCSVGRWRQSGRHPFRFAVETLLLPSLGLEKIEDLLGLLEPEGELVPGTFAGRFARYVAGGLAIGSEAFVRGVMRTIFGEERVLNRELPVLLDEEDELFAWSRPRAPAG